MSETLLTVSFTHLTCYKPACGVLFAVPSYFEQKRREDREAFYCPNGHGQMFHGKSEAEKLRDQLADAERKSKFWADRTSEERGHVMERERTIRAMKGHSTRMRKRAAAGLCPCCKRTFQNLARHMHGQHPKYAEVSP